MKILSVTPCIKIFTYCCAAFRCRVCNKQFHKGCGLSKKHFLVSNRVGTNYDVFIFRSSPHRHRHNLRAPAGSLSVQKPRLHMFQLPSARQPLLVREEGFRKSSKEVKVVCNKNDLEGVQKTHSYKKECVCTYEAFNAQPTTNPKEFVCERVKRYLGN